MYVTILRVSVAMSETSCLLWRTLTIVTSKKDLCFLYYIFSTKNMFCVCCASSSWDITIPLGKHSFHFEFDHTRNIKHLYFSTQDIFSLCPLHHNCHRRAEKRIGWRFDNCARVHFCFKGFRRMTMHTGGRWWCRVHQNALFAPFDHFLSPPLFWVSFGNWTWLSSTTFCFCFSQKYLRTVQLRWYIYCWMSGALKTIWSIVSIQHHSVGTFCSLVFKIQPNSTEKLMYSKYDDLICKGNCNYSHEWCLLYPSSCKSKTLIKIRSPGDNTWNRLYNGWRKPY